MTNSSLIRLAGALTALTAFTCAASAQITYVDATHGAEGNTARLDWNAGTESWDSSVWDPLTANQGTANDGVWAFRTGFGNSSGIYQNGATGDPDDAHPLLTTVNGLAENTYNVFVYFWSSDDGGFPGSWPIRATLDGAGDPGPWTLYSPGTEAPVTVAEAINFMDPMVITEGNRTLFQAHLGQVTGTSLSIYIDDLPKTSTDGSGRTWYDGVGYEVIPEPGTYALFLGLGALGFLAFRRFRR